MSQIFETERLILREFTIADTSFIIELLNTEDWIRFIGDRNVKNEEQAKLYLENGSFKSYKENGFGLSLVLRKEDQLFIGMCGLLKRKELEIPDLGFAFLPDYQNQGYGFEIANYLLIFAKEKLNISQVCAIIVPENNISILLIEKLGLVFKNKILLNQEELLYYCN